MQAKKERLEDWGAVLADASRRAEALALAFEDAGARTGDVGMALIRLGRFQVSTAYLVTSTHTTAYTACQRWTLELIRLGCFQVSND